jgi:hypothetical protein
MRSSTDNGKTWSDATTVAGGTTIGRDGMPGCTSFSGTPSKILCVFETTEGSGTLFTVKSVVSNDDGTEWGGRSQVYVPIGSGNNGLRYFPSRVTSISNFDIGRLSRSWISSSDYNI